MIMTTMCPVTGKDTDESENVVSEWVNIEYHTRGEHANHYYTTDAN
jgi:hypothetical protein